MFMLTQGPGVNSAYPDTCNTPAAAGAPVPIPYADIATTATTEPSAENVLICCMPAVTQLAQDLISNGDEAGCMMGLASLRIDGESVYMVGCITIFTDGIPSQRLTSVTGQNAMGVLPNAPGMTASPSQVTVLTLG
jgi:hypothetical protein